MFDKYTLRALLWGVTAFLIVMLIGERLFPPPPAPPPDSQAPSTAPDGSPTTGSGAPATQAPSEPGQPQPTGDGADDDVAVPDAAHGFAVANEAVSEETVEIGSVLDHDGDEEERTTDEDSYRMHIVLSNVGASVQEVTLTDHLETLEGDERYKLLDVVELADGRLFRSLAVKKINVNNIDISLGNKLWRVEREDTADGQTVRFSIDVTEHGQPALRLVRTYTLPAQDRKSLLHDLEVDLAVENVGSRQYPVIVEYGGGIGIRQIAARIDGRAVDIGLMQGDLVVGHRKRFSEIVKTAQHRTDLYSSDEAQPGTRLTWAATANQFFTCTIAPMDRDGTDSPSYISEVDATQADPSGAGPEAVTISFVTRGESILPGAALHYSADVYIGDKSIKSFKNVPRYKSRNYYYQVSQGYGWCTFTWLVELMIWLLNGLHFVVRDYGVALIILVMVVRVLLHPITKKGQVNMVKMQKRMGSLAPKVEEIKKKYANDKVRLQQEQMKLYREEGINPMGQLFTCLPMALQMPIWVALYMSLSNNVLMRHQPFWFTWIKDLTTPDALFTFSPITLPIYGEISSFNLLPFILSGSMYLQQKLMPKPTPSPNQTKQQRDQAEMMQKMMPIMSIMMLFFFYTAPSGLTLYIMASTIFGTIEQHRIRKHVREQEAAGTFDKKAPKKEGGPKRPGSGILQRIQKMAEDAQKRQPSSAKARRR